MKKYRFRPYFAYDCDTVNGFNNGKYLDDIVIKADNEFQAREKVIDKLGGDFNYSNSNNNKAIMLGVDFCWTSNKLFNDDNYSFQYLDLGDPEEL